MARDLKGAIGVLGGTFDPVTVAHLSVAQQVRRRLGLRKVLLIPAGTPPHKPPAQLAPAADRLVMTELAAKEMLGLEVSGMEVESPGPSYTIDTLRRLSGVLDSPVVFIIGADTLDELASWKDVGALVDEFEFAIVGRPGYICEVPAALEDKIGGELARKLRDSFVEIETANVSSTMARERLAAGEPAGGMVRAPVELYIRTHGLYGAGVRREAKPGGDTEGGVLASHATPSRQRPR